MAGVGEAGASPSSAAGGGEGREIAMRMIQAAEAAALAAQSAADALSRRQGGEETWFKVLPKPSQLDAKTREEELSQWRDFSWGLEQYLSSRTACSQKISKISGQGQTTRSTPASL